MQYIFENRTISTKFGNISAKIELYLRNCGYISENCNISTKQRIYHQNSDYIDENQDISSKLGLYRRKTAIYHQNSDYIDEKQQHIFGNRIISTKIGNISAKIELYLRNNSK
ncbi:hypothetical protein CON84_24810 [Bacillus sp. AFS094228]|nr:hypothetical protein CON84_24810 [Bacillus sp. AFS094228]